MAFSFVSAGAESNLTAAGTLAPGLPAGYQAGDIFILITVTRAGSGLPNPSGYTIVDDVTEGSTLSVRVSRKIATSSETAPTFSVTVASRAVILCYRSSVGLGISVESFSTISDATGTILQSDNLVSTQSTNLAVLVWGTTNVAGTLTGNAGYTTRFTGNPTASAMGILSTDAVQTLVDAQGFNPTNATSSVSLASANVGFVLRENSTVYWVGGTGNWSSANAVNWSLSSGGTGSQSIPKLTDSVVIDSSSGTGTITCGSFADCNNLTVTASQAITLTSGALTIYGSVSFPSGGSFSAGTPFTFAATSTGKTITTNGKTFPSSTFNGNGSWTLQDALDLSNRDLTLTSGTLNLNNQNVTCGTFSSNNSNNRTLTMGSGTFTLAEISNPPITPWNVATSTNFTLNANTSTIVLRSSSDGSANNAPGTVVTFAGGGLTYNNLTFANAASNNVLNPVFAITGANTFNTIASTRTNAYTVQLPTGVTTTVSTWSANGLLNNSLSLRSATAGTTGTLAVTNTFTINYAFVRDINLTVLNRGTVDNGLVVNSANWALGSGSSFGDILTSGTSWTVPSSWTSGNNVIHIIGGGGGGSGGITSASAGGGGGGGGGYSRLVNYSATPSNVIRYSIGLGGGGGSAGSALVTSTGVTGGTTGFAGTAQTIAFVSQQVSVQTSNTTTITATVPSVSNGNLMILIANSSSTSATWTTPAGWTLGTAGANGRALFWRIASSEPASYVLTQSGSNTADAIILVFSNARFDTSGLATQSISTTIQPVNITVESANSTIVYVASTQSVASVTFTTPTGYTSRAVDSDATAPSCSVFSLANVAAGTYTAPTTVTSGGNSARAYVMALSPAITSFTASATGGSGGSSSASPLFSNGGAGGTGSGGSVNYTGGTGGAGATSGAAMRTGGGGGGAAGPNGNGGNGGAGGGNTPTTSAAGGGGGNGGGTAGGAGSSVSRLSGAGGNNSLGTGGGAAITTSNDGNPGTRGGGGSGAADNTRIGGAGGNGIDIAGVIGSGGGSGGGTNANQTQSAGLYGGGGGGAGVSSGSAGAGGSGAQGAIIITWATTAPAPTATGNFFFLFM